MNKANDLSDGVHWMIVLLYHSLMGSAGQHHQHINVGADDDMQGFPDLSSWKSIVAKASFAEQGLLKFLYCRNVDAEHSAGSLTWRDKYKWATMRLLLQKSVKSYSNSWECSSG